MSYENLEELAGESEFKNGEIEKGIMQGLNICLSKEVDKTHDDAINSFFKR